MCFRTHEFGYTELHGHSSALAPYRARQKVHHTMGRHGGFEAPLGRCRKAQLRPRERVHLRQVQTVALTARCQASVLERIVPADCNAFLLQLEVD